MSAGHIPRPFSLALPPTLAVGCPTKLQSQEAGRGNNPLNIGVVSA